MYQCVFIHLFIAGAFFSRLFVVVVVVVVLEKKLTRPQDFLAGVLLSNDSHELTKRFDDITLVIITSYNSYLLKLTSMTHIHTHTQITNTSLAHRFNIYSISRLWFLFLFPCIVRYLLLRNSKLFVAMLKFHCSIKFVVFFVVAFYLFSKFKRIDIYYTSRIEYYSIFR